MQNLQILNLKHPNIFEAEANTASLARSFIAVREAATGQTQEQFELNQHVIVEGEETDSHDTNLKYVEYLCGAELKTVPSTQ